MFAIHLVVTIGLAHLAGWVGANPEHLLTIQDSENRSMRKVLEVDNSASTVQVEVRVMQARSDRGAILALMFATSEGFPSRPERAVDRAKSIIEDGEAQLVFRAVPAGKYAVVVIHDENNNQVLDTNFLGIPKEGVGVSNNPQTRMGPPRFKDAKFMVDHRDLKKRIVLNYL